MDVLAPVKPTLMAYAILTYLLTIPYLLTYHMENARNCALTAYHMGIPYGRFETFWDALGRSGTFWDVLARSGTFWDALGKTHLPKLYFSNTSVGIKF